MADEYRRLRKRYRQLRALNQLWPGPGPAPTVGDPEKNIDDEHAKWQKEQERKKEEERAKREFESRSR